MANQKIQELFQIRIQGYLAARETDAPEAQGFGLGQDPPGQGQGEKLRRVLFIPETMQTLEIADVGQLNG